MRPSRALAFWCLAFVVAGSALSLPAQQPRPAAPGGVGTVSGTVICDDTQRPARFAQVMLFGVPAEVTATPSSSSATPDPAHSYFTSPAGSTALG